MTLMQYFTPGPMFPPLPLPTGCSVLISAALNAYLLQGGGGKLFRLLDYHLRCGHCQLLCHGLGDGDIKEEDYVSKIVIFVFIVIVQGAIDGGGGEGCTTGYFFVVGSLHPSSSSSAFTASPPPPHNPPPLILIR